MKNTNMALTMVGPETGLTRDEIAPLLDKEKERRMSMNYKKSSDDHEAYRALRNSLTDLSKKTQEDDCRIVYWLYDDDRIYYIGFEYDTLFSTTKHMELSGFYTWMQYLDLSKKQSCKTFVSNIKKSVDSIIHNPQHTRVDLKRYWRENYEMEQSDATRYANWLWDVAPKVYKAIREWLSTYSVCEN